MPVYEYTCTNEACQNNWEEDASIKDDPQTKCPQCKKKTAKRLISGSSFVLAGGGWANEGYNSK